MRAACEDDSQRNGGPVRGWIDDGHDKMDEIRGAAEVSHVA